MLTSHKFIIHVLRKIGTQHDKSENFQRPCLRLFPLHIWLQNCSTVKQDSGQLQEMES